MKYSCTSSIIVIEIREGELNMKKYTVTTSNLRALCIENNWFTCGDNHQYEKLFYANENGCSIEEIATIIWLCSDDSEWRRIDILAYSVEIERLGRRN